MKKRIFHNLPIQSKVILPVILFLFVSFAGVICYYHFVVITNNIEADIQSDYQNFVKNYKKDQLHINSQFNASIQNLVSQPNVIAGLEAYFIDSLKKALIKTVNKTSDHLHNILSIDTRIHITIYEGVSFYRSWSDQQGDLLMSRPSVSFLYNKQLPGKGIEAREEEPVLYSMAPVFNEEGIMLGGAEISTPYTALIENENDSSDIFTTVVYKKSTHNDNIRLASGISILDSYQVSENGALRLKHELFTEKMLNEIDKKTTYMHVNNIAFFFSPVVDLNNQLIGYIVQQRNYNQNYAFYQKTRTVLILSLSTLLAITLLLFILVLNHTILNPLEQIQKSLKALAKGEHNRRIKIKSDDEIGHLKRTINHINESFINIEYFAHEIGEGKLDANFKPRSKKDSLANTLLDMKGKLKKTKEDAEKSSAEEKQREWSNEGLAKLNNILRNNNQNKEALFYDVIAHLVKYMDANQGGLFLLNEEKEYLEMKSCYAYDRNKFMQRKIHVKEGLIGRCYQEKEHIIIQNIPDSYMKIVSAIGENSPSYLLLMPLLHDDEVRGVIEVASFHEINESHIAFILESCRQISLALNDLEYTEKTQKLLQDSRDKEQKLVQQEEEMRQNMEEMKATQEEFERRERDLLAKLNEKRSKTSPSVS